MLGKLMQAPLILMNFIIFIMGLYQSFNGTVSFIFPTIFGVLLILYIIGMYINTKE
jgi:hypothetical protein